MNIPYLVKTIKSNKFSDLVNVIDEVPLDMNLALWDAVDNGEISFDEAKDRVKVLVAATPWHDPALASKIVRVIQHYAADQESMTRGRLDQQIKDPVTNEGYKRYEYLMTLQYLIDEGQVLEEPVSVPGVKNKRPPRTFVFLTLPENAEYNEDWNAKTVNRWLASYQSSKVK